MNRAAKSMKKVKINIEKVCQAASSRFADLTQKQKDPAENLFRAIDVGKKGHISIEKFRTYLTMAGLEGKNCDSLFEDLGKDKDGSLSFTEMITFFYVLLQRNQLSRANTVGTSGEGQSSDCVEIIHLVASVIQIVQLLAQTGCTIA